MAKTSRFEARLSDEGRAALDLLMTHYGLTAAAVIEMVVRESVARLDGGSRVRVTVGPGEVIESSGLETDAVEARKVKRAARVARKTELAESIKAALPGKRPAGMVGSLVPARLVPSPAVQVQDEECLHPARWRRGPKCLQCGKRNDSGEWT